MAFTNAWLEADPDGAVITGSLLDDHIRLTKRAVRERLEGDPANPNSGIYESGTFGATSIVKAGSARAYAVAVAGVAALTVQDGRIAITTDTNRLYHLKATGAVELAYLPLTGGVVTSLTVTNALVAGSFTVPTAAQPNITSVGVLMGLTVNSGVNRNFIVTTDATQNGTAGIAIGSFTDGATAYAPLSIVGSFIAISSNLGIGLGFGVAPSHRLHVSGNALITGTLAASAAATLSSTLAVTGALTANGGIVSTNAAALTGSGQTTGAQYIQITNTGGGGLFGIEASTGSALVAGSAVYATLVSAAGNTSLQLCTNNAVRLTITGAGAATFAGTLAVTGATTLSSTLAVTGDIETTGVLRLTSAVPRFRIRDTDGTVNKRIMDWVYTNDRLELEARDDAGTWLRNVLAITHDGAVSMGGALAINGAMTGVMTLAVSSTSTLTGNVGIGGVGVAAEALYVRAIGTLTGVTQVGIESVCDYSAAATASVLAFVGQVRTVASAFTTGAGYGYYLASPNIGSTAITTIYGAYISNQGQAKSTNAYGIYIDAVSGAATTNIGLYNAGTTTLVGAVSLGSSLAITGALTGVTTGAFSGSIAANAGLVVAASQAITGTVANSTISGFLSVTATTFVGNVTGTILTATQPNITSLGTLINLAMSGRIALGANSEVNNGTATAAVPTISETIVGTITAPTAYGAYVVTAGFATTGNQGAAFLFVTYNPNAAAPWHMVGVTVVASITSLSVNTDGTIRVIQNSGITVNITTSWTKLG